MAFLTLMDDRAKPKGSRDPLGFELVWTWFGRKLIGNLTTITGSLNNFAVAILGFHWAHQLAYKADAQERHTQIKAHFLRFEQLAAYLRYYGNADDIMGITRVRQRMLDPVAPLTLGLSSKQMILSDQASYGLWGLYSSAARDTGLVEGNDRELTPLGKELVNIILDGLGDTQPHLFGMLTSGVALNRQVLEDASPTFMHALRQKTLQSRLLEALMGGPPDHEQQKAFWELTRRLLTNPSEPKPQNVPELFAAVMAVNTDAALQQVLQNIQDIERLLVACNDLFHYTRRKNGRPLDEVLKDFADRRDYSYLPHTLPNADFPRRDELARILVAFHANDLHTTLVEILALNKMVMHQRSGAPWVELENDRVLRVRVISETAELKKPEDLQTTWDYDYFVGSFLAIAKQQLAAA